MRLEIISKPSSGARVTPLLFVHGAWHAAWCWDVYFLDFFAREGFHAFALSLRGHGGSEGRERLPHLRISDYVDDVATVVARLPSSPILVGHSMGGFVVQKYLERFSAPAGVLLASVPPTGVVRTALRLTRRRPFLMAKSLAALSLFPLVATPALAQEAFFSHELSQDKASAFSSRLQDESFMAFLDMLGLDLPAPKKAKAPMLVFGGETDALLRPGEVEATACAYGTRARLIAGVAHDMMLEAKWIEVAQSILKAIAEDVRCP